MNNILYKGSLLVSLLFIAVASLAKPMQNDWNSLARSTVWQALLHAPSNQSQLTDQSFFSGQDNGIEKELYHTYEFLFSNGQAIPKNICRFPARYIWLKQQLNLSGPQPEEVCEDYKEYIQKVPVDKIKLVYAAENITQPSSMMGHAFLKFEGTNFDGQEVAHAVSFYTEVDTLNIPYLIYETLLVGKQGYFLVSPYEEKKLFYTNIEQRNLIEYELKLSAQQKHLIQAHMWELKQTDLKYFFQKYNCATLTNNIIGIASQDVLHQSIHWLTPLDVVKHVSNAKLIANSQLLPTPKWRMRMLQDAIDSSTLIDAAQAWTPINSEQPSMSENTRYLFSELVKTNAIYQWQQHNLEQEQLESYLTDERLNNADLMVTLSQYKDPLQRKNDSQISVGIEKQGKVWVRLLPASHLISDDHRNAYSESELQLFSTTLSYDNGLKIDELTLYRIASLIPNDQFSGGISGRFSIGAKHFYDKALNKQFAGYIAGALGKTYSLHHDIAIYGLGHASLLFDDQFSVTYGTEVGLYIYEILNQKTNLLYRITKGQLDTDKLLYELELTHSWFIKPDLSVIGHFSSTRLDNEFENRFGIEVRHYF